MGGAVEFEVVWPRIAEDQAGVVARRQLLAAGVTPGAARRALKSRRWQSIHPGVYATFTGPIPDRARVWAAVLSAGPGAVAGHRTALWLAGVLDAPPGVLDVVIPNERHPGTAAGFRMYRVYRMRDLAAHTHPAASPPRLRLESALLVTTQTVDRSDAVLELVFRATQRRLTTASRLRDLLQDWPRHRWRGLLNAVLTEVDDGVQSPLEHRYVNAVERAHGLPTGRRNQREVSGRYRDVRYEDFGTVVELDGREAHPLDAAFRDLRRDNLVVVGGEQVLRYGWRDVTTRPCEVAAQVAQALAGRGWSVPFRACSTCRAQTSRGIRSTG